MRTQLLSPRGLTLLLAGVVIASACAPAAPAQTAPATSSLPPTIAAATAAPTSAPGLLAAIKQRGSIIIGTSNDVPFAFFEPDSTKLKGIDAEMISRMAETMGVKVEVYITDFSTLIPALLAKKIDIIVDAMYITDKRKETISFTDPWYREGEGLVVAKNNTTIKSVDDLKGKVVGAQTGTEFLKFVQTLPVRDVKVYDSQATALLDLQNGRVDAVITDSATAGYVIAKDPTLRIRLVSPYTAKFAGLIGAGVRQDNTDLLAEVNRLLKELKTQGKDLEILQTYGLGQDNRVP